MQIWLPQAPSYFGLEQSAQNIVIRAFDEATANLSPTDLEELEFLAPPLFASSQAVIDLVERAPNLQVVQSMSAGVEHLVGGIRPGVTLCTASSAHHTATAEMALALMLSVLRGLHTVAVEYDWNQRLTNVWPGLADRKVLIVGYGSIGQAIERRLSGFECEVLRIATTAREKVRGIDELDALLPLVDVVVLTVPHTSRTQGLIGAQQLEALPDGALVVNVSRGPIVDTAALTQEVTSGRLFAALDVTDPEPMPADHPLLSHPNALVAPHIAGRTAALEPRLNRLVRQQVGRFLRGEELLHVVTGEY